MRYRVVSGPGSAAPSTQHSALSTQHTALSTRPPAHRLGGARALLSVERRCYDPCVSELFSLNERDLVPKLVHRRSALPPLPLILAVLLHILLLVTVLDFSFGPPTLNFVLKQPQVAAQYDTVRLIYYPTGETGSGGGGGGGGRDEERPANKAAVPGPQVAESPMKRADEPPVTEAPIDPVPEPPRVETPVTLPGGGTEAEGVIVEPGPPPPASGDRPPSGGTGTGGGIGSGVGPGIGSGTGPGIGPGSGGGAGGGPYRPGGGVSLPRLMHEEKVKYPEEARRHSTTGVVILEAVVRADGSVGDIRVIRPLPDGCIEASIAALKKWRFLPGRKGGVPVDVYFLVTFTFS